MSDDRVLGARMTVFVDRETTVYGDVRIEKWRLQYDGDHLSADLNLEQPTGSKRELTRSGVPVTEVPDSVLEAARDLGLPEEAHEPV